MRLPLLLIALLAGLVYGDPSWKKPGACLAQDGTPCRTLKFRLTFWRNIGWFIPDVEWSRWYETEAVRSDGASLQRITHRSYRHFTELVGSYDRVRVVLPVQRRTFEIEHSLRQYRDLGGTWSWVWPSWLDRPDCAAKPRRTGKYPVIAGIPTVEYLWEDGRAHVSERVSFAPSLGCIALAMSFEERNEWGWTVSRSTREAESVSLGEPEPTLFAIPAGYAAVSADAPWRYVRMGDFPEDVTGTWFFPGMAPSSGFLKRGDGR